MLPDTISNAVPPADAPEQGRFLSLALARGEPFKTYLLGLVMFLLGCLLMMLPAALIVLGGRALVGDLGDKAAMVQISLKLGSCIVPLLSLAFVMSMIHDRSPWELISPDARPRLVLAFRAAGLYFLIIIGPLTLLPWLAGRPPGPSWWLVPGLFLLLVPFVLVQVTFEEMLFRGYLGQAVMVLTKRRWVVYGATSLIFAATHGKFWARGAWDARIFYVGIGLLLIWAADRANRLEPAIGIHLAHNLVVMSLFDWPDWPDKPSLFADGRDMGDGGFDWLDCLFTAAVLVLHGLLFWYLGIKRNWLGLDPAATPRSALEPQPASA